MRVVQSPAAFIWDFRSIADRNGPVKQVSEDEFFIFGKKAGIAATSIKWLPNETIKIYEYKDTS